MSLEFSKVEERMDECIKCRGEVLPMHILAGHKLCVSCRDKRAIQARASWCVAPMNKSNYILITNPEELKQLNPKRTT